MQVTLFAYSDLLLFTKEDEPGRCNVLRNPLYLQSVKLQEGECLPETPWTASALALSPSPGLGGMDGWDVWSGPARGFGCQSLVFQSRLAVPAVDPELCREISAPPRFWEGLGVEWEECWIQTDLCSNLGLAPCYLCHFRQVPGPL